MTCVFRKAVTLVACAMTFALAAGGYMTDDALGAAQKSMRLDIKTASPMELGTRYGQAAGIALVCYGLRVTPAVDGLKTRFDGADKDKFDKQANKILAAWQRTLRCEDAGGPNECKLSQTWSCAQGYKELGPEGTVIPGLVERKVE